MSDPARRKEKQRLKRKQKQQALRREKNLSPARIFSAAAERGMALECFGTPDWKDKGILSMHCLRQLPGGGYAMAAFLIDLWCIGLKDAWGRVQISRAEFMKNIERMREGPGTVPFEEDLARRLVAGGVRFANQNGFRLPPRWDRWASLLGDIGETAQADLSDFGKDGKILFIGEMDDLAKRLIRGTPQDFFQRPGVDYVAGIGGSVTGETDDGDDIEEGLSQTEDKAYDGICRWLFANGRQPHPRLREALELFLDSIVLSEAKTEADMPAGTQAALEVFVAAMTPEQRADFEEAMTQLRDYAAQFQDGEAFAEAIGFAGEDEE